MLTPRSRITSGGIRGAQAMCQHGWIDGWMDGWVVGWMDGWMSFGIVSGHHANISHVANNCRGLPPKLLLGDKIHREINIYKHDLGL